MTFSRRTDSQSTPYQLGAAQESDANVAAVDIERLAILSRIDRAIMTVQSPEEVAFVTLSNLLKILPYEHASVLIFDYERGEADVLAYSHAEKTRFGTGNSLPLTKLEMAPVLQAGRVCLIEDLAASELAHFIQEELHTQDLTALIAVPLLAQDMLIGALLLGSSRDGGFGESHVEMVSEVASRMAASLQGVRTLEAEQRYATELERRVAERTAALARSSALIAALSQVATRVQTSPDPQQAIETLGAELQRLEVSSMVALHDPAQQGLIVRYYTAESGMQTLIDQIAEQTDQGLVLTRRSWPFYSDLMEQGRALYLPDAMIRAVEDLFDLPANEVNAILAASGITSTSKSIYLPLVMEDRILGVMLLWGRELQEVDISAIKIFAGQIAASLEMAHLHDRLKSQRVAEQEALLRLSQALLKEIDVQAVIDQTVSMVDDVFGADASVMMLSDGPDDPLLLRGSSGLAPRTATSTPIPLDERSIATQALITRQPVFLAGPQAESGLQPPRLPTPKPLQAGLSVPMLAGRQVLGVLSILWSQARSISTDESRLLSLFANTAAQSIERGRLYEAESQAHSQADTLRAATLALTQTLDLKIILETLLTIARQLIPFESASVLLFNDDGLLTLQAQAGENQWPALTAVGTGHLDPSRHALLTRLVASQRSVRLDAVSDTAAEISGELLQPYRCWLGVPLVSGGKVIGIYSFSSSHDGAFQSDHLNMAEILAGQAAVAIQNALLFKEVHSGRERLQTLSHRLVEVQEIERRRVAKELHEEIGQYLAGLSFTLEMASRLPPDALQQQMRAAREIVKSLTVQVRELSLALRPTLLDDMGLLHAMEWHFDRFSKQTHIRIDFEPVGLAGKRFAPSVETALFRILQEALSNVAHHAHTDQVHVYAEAANAKLTLQITDQGKGFDREATRNHPDFSGISDMEERALLLGGHFTIESQPSQGTRLTVTVPIE